MARQGSRLRTRGAMKAESGKGGGSDKIACWHCDQMGHYLTDCPTATAYQKKEWQKAAENAKRARAQRPTGEQGRANVASAGDVCNDAIAEEGAPEGAAAQEELLAAGHESKN
jgi:protocatechuate 3,4-dioxygenase beta subunit